MSAKSSKAPRIGRAAGLVLGALALSGCMAMPIGTMDRAAITSAGAQAQTDLFFRPGSAQFLPGEAARVNGLLRSLVLNDQDDVVLVFGSTGSDTLDARRVAAARQSIAPGPARLRIAHPLGFARVPDPNPDIVLVQIRRHDRILVTCPGSGRTNEATAILLRIPTEGCANAVNLAHQASEKRDLTAPRRLEGAQAIPSAAAIATYRAGRVTVPPVGSTSN